MLRTDGQLLRFRVSNYRSLRDEQELSFMASTAGKDDPRLLHPDGLDEAVVPVCAMYGANASGKSNVLKALGFMQHAVFASHRLWAPTEAVPREPFALGAENENVSTFIADLMLAGVRYEYGFALDDEAVREEWLRAWPNGRKQEWFSREDQKFDIGRALHGENKAIESITRPNSLFLSAAAQNNHEQLTPIFEWFASRLQGGKPSMNSASATSWWKQFASKGAGQEADALRQQVRALLRAADLGIEDFSVTEELAARAVRYGKDEQLNAWLRQIPQLSQQQLRFAHRAGGKSAWLDLEQESTGTQTLVAMMPILLPLLASGGVLAIDELSSLHPMLALALVQLFQDPQRNPRGVQLLFNTHDSSLLGNLLSDPPPLRRDQIWLTEKDQEGATRLYPLTDYTPRAAENLERGYLQGRYGAVPFLGSFDPSASEPADG